MIAIPMPPVLITLAPGHVHVMQAISEMDKPALVNMQNLISKTNIGCSELGGQ